MIKLPAVFLTFDDNFLSLWASVLPRLQDADIEATFYLSNIGGFSLNDWNNLGRIIRAGHTIGYHGFNHLRVTDGIRDMGWIKYQHDEIFQGLELIKKNMGIKAIRHYSYPWGTGTIETDRSFLTIFDTLRYGGREFFSNDDLLKKKTIFHAANFGKNPKAEECGNEDIVHYTVSHNFATVLLMHKPIPHRLDWLELMKKKHNINFYGMDAVL